MAIDTHEPRALTAALAQPAFATRGAGLALHVADRHVERWAPESGANRVRPLRNLGFVDRLVSPWIETAQRSASLRLFSQYHRDGMSERAGGDVSWVFPRPWYQDELAWMAAARQAPRMQSPDGEARPMLTTRGTYVPPASAQVAMPREATALPAALYEYVAPSLSIAAPTAVTGVGHGGESLSNAAWSPLVSLAAVQAAEVMSRAVTPTLAAGGASSRMSPALRNVLSTMLERAAMPARAETPMTRLAGDAPELVTPPAPRPDWTAPTAPRADDVTVGGVSTSGMSASQAQAAHAQAQQAMQLAQQYAEQRAKIVEVQRLAQKAAEREITARIEAQRAERAASTPAATAATTEAEARAIAARTEELRQRTAAARGEAVAQSQATAQAQANEAQKQQLAEATAERARIEERIAQRVAERQRGETRARTLHEQARIEAATHARELQIAPVAGPVTTTAPAAPAIPAEVAAAFAALPPELAAYIGQRPDQALRAIDELSEAMRTVELMARTTAAGGSFSSSRGPRLMMPAGIGGLVSAVDRAHAISPAAQMQPALAPLPMTAARPSTLASSARVPNLAFLRPETLAPTRTEAGSARIAATAPTSTFASVSGNAPAALEHVAWADRWLARFAGASGQSLDTFSAAGGRMQSLVEAAPGGVFVAPMFDSERHGERVRVDASTGRVIVSSPLSGGMSMPALAAATATSARATGAPELTSFVAPTPMRFDDNAETPDDVFAAISAAATRNRAAAIAPTAPAATATPAPTTPFDRTTAADLVAHTAPSAPGAGFAAQLASSPFAPALRHVLPMASAATFDVRALFGGNVSATYLAGLIAAGSEEVELAVPTMPSWATWGDTAFPASATVLEREAPSFDAAYVAGEDALRPAASASTEDAAAPATAAPLATLRTALLSWSADVPTFDAAASGGISPTVLTSAQSQPITTSAARAMIDAMSLPLLDDTFHPLSMASPVESPAFAAPGMIGSRAQAWSVAQERSTSDLALDFVSPELVLAARVYGLGPAEAAQAARLAIAGPGPLGAMASTVDRTFVQAMAIESDRRIATIYPSGDAANTQRASTSAPAGVATGATPTGEAATPMTEAMRSLATSSSGTAFGVDRRAPRGAFLWPSATVAALGLHAAGPDGEQSMSVAALELLAAQAVAELGTFAALSPANERGGFASDDEVVTSASDVRGPATVSTLPTIGAATASGAPGRIAEPSEQDVLDAAVSMVPSARRSRFEALYVALGQTGASSPAARAARALALAGRGEETLTARERASLAWDVLPVVYAADGRALDAEAEDANSPAFAQSRMPVVASRGGAPSSSPSSRAGRGADTTYVDADLRPGLGSLSARAGEALGSYVAPSETRREGTTSSSSASGQREVGAVLRAPTAAQELVRTGRPSGRFGGGEVEIPTWFEAAARKMLEERSGASDGISLAELTLVTAAPTTQVAASSRAVPTAAPLAPGATTSKDGAGKGEPIDVEKIANEIYRHILTMMDAARERNGEPYL